MPYERFTIPQITGRNGTRERLMMAGEDLMGQRGFDAVSLEEIAQQAKQRNKYAVQYHFGSRDGLAQAILDVRFRQIESRRAALSESVDPRDLRSIFTAFIAPLAEQTDSAGRHSFARFLLQFGIREGPADGIMHPVMATQDGSPTLDLFAMARRAIGIEAEELYERIKLFLPVSLRFLAEQEGGVDSPVIPPDFAQVIRMIAAALAVPAKERG